MSLRQLNKTQLAEICNLDRRTVNEKLKGIEPLRIEGKSHVYDTHTVLPILMGSNELTEQSARVQLLNEQLRHETAKADRAILEVKKLQQEVVQISEVGNVVADEYTRVRARLISIPSRCARDLAIEQNPRNVEIRLDDEINEALSELTADRNYTEIENAKQFKETTHSDSTENA